LNELSGSLDGGGEGGTVGGSLGSLVDFVGVDGSTLGLGDVVALVGSVVVWSGSGFSVALLLADGLGDRLESTGR
jgi:hypothetical protein